MYKLDLNPIHFFSRIIGYLQCTTSPGEIKGAEGREKNEGIMSVQ